MPINYRLLFVVLSFLYSISFSAQTITLNGAVVDAESDSPLPFAYVIMDTANIATVTDGDGNFKISFSKKFDDANIKFTYLGYEDRLVSVSELLEQKRISIKLNPIALDLNEVVLVSKKKIIKPRALLKRVIKNIPNNYPQDSFYLEGYYRETVKENNVHIKFTDGQIAYRSMPYQNKNYRWKDYSNNWSIPNGSVVSLGNVFMSQGLHRIHFHHRTLKGDQVKVMASRSSENLSPSNTDPSIEGGPLSLFARDQLKFLEAFTGKKKFRDFNYTVVEDNIKGQAVYILSFRTSTTKEKLDELGQILKVKPNNTKQWRFANNRKLLQGKMTIDKSSYAVLSYECSVPNELKDYFCGYKYEDFKHFDYKVNASYVEEGGKYYLDHIRHEDEFLILDSIEQSRTPFAAISEFHRRNTQKSFKKPFANQDLFVNVMGNVFHELAVDYDSAYWANYLFEEPLSQIDSTIRSEMEVNKPLEQQFQDKHLRDENLEPPIANIIPTDRKIHGTTLNDDYAWMKNPKYAKQDTAIMNYINKENAYSENYFRPLRKVQKGIFSELSATVEDEFESLPNENNGYQYFYRYHDGDEHPTYFRYPTGQKDKEEIILDVNEMAKEKPYYSAGGITVSPDNSLMAFGENTTGSDQYVLKFKNLNTDELLVDSILNISGGIWVNNKTLLYTVQEKRTLRSYQLKKHTINTSYENDPILYEEMDPQYGISISKSRSKKFIYLNASAGGLQSSEYRFTSISDTSFNFKIIHPRKAKHNYSISHYNDQFYIVTNKDGNNNAIYTTDTSDYEINSWKPYQPISEEVTIQGIVNFDNHIAIAERIQLQEQIRIIDRATNKDHIIKFKKKIHSVGIGSNPKTNTSKIRINYSSPSEPNIVYDYGMDSKDFKEIKKSKPYPFLWMRSLKVEQIWATAKDGTQIPMTVMHNKWKGWLKDTSNHVNTYMTSYGSYGASSSIGYDPVALALINRGFIYVVPHVRGGGDLGTEWHEGGKMYNKTNTFTDFIACAEHLIDIGLAEKGRITAQGGSAGGLLMGAIANMRPDLFMNVILDVPFVDVVNTMLDPNLPLTTGEYAEWGNPNKKKDFKYMLSYSPYDNVKAQDYPNMLFYTALNDTRVGYWEPAKMVAKLRKMKTDDNEVLLHTNLNGGHGGGSGRFAGLQQLAQQFALIADLYNKKNKP